MSKRGDTTTRDNLRNMRVVQIEEMLAKPGFTKQERKMLKDKIKLIKRVTLIEHTKLAAIKATQ